MVPNEVPWWGAVSFPPVRGDAMCGSRKEISLTYEDPREGLDMSGTSMGEALERACGVAKAG